MSNSVLTFPKVAVLISQNLHVRLVEFSESERLSAGKELFPMPDSEPRWLGFYDWLRTENGEVIGVHLQPDDGEIEKEILSFLLPLNGGNSERSIYIFFGKERKFDQALSDDADFGGNFILRGTKGTLAITFNTPTPRQ